MQLNKIGLRFDNGKMVALALLYFSKAFDAISHILPLAKLKCFIFDMSAINLIESYLKN